MYVSPPLLLLLVSCRPLFIFSFIVFVVVSRCNFYFSSTITGNFTTYKTGFALTDNFNVNKDSRILCQILFTVSSMMTHTIMTWERARSIQNKIHVFVCDFLLFLTSIVFYLIFPFFFFTQQQQRVCDKNVFFF